MYEHSKLIKIREAYKKDMMTNQDEFVYVTWQERQRHQLARQYLEMAKRKQESRKLEKRMKEEAAKKKEELNYGQE